MRRTIIGSIFTAVGLIILFNTLAFFSNSFVAPLIFLALGVFFVKKQKRKWGRLCFFLATVIFFAQVFNIDIFTLFFALLLLYAGWKMVRSDKKPKQKKQRKQVVRQNEQVQEDKPVQQSGDSHTLVKRSLLGEVRYTHSPFELTDMTIWNGIGDVRIDLSKAIISEGETLLIVQNVIGDIHIYVPEDLGYAIQSYVVVGDSSILHSKHGGFNQSVLMRSSNYENSIRKVKLVLSCAVGSVKVREI
ncbi:cell wall-active antibiotics response protein LiaF [Alkalicoccobacillus murimartini]|uniref:Lia operon protein LiaF n=1 Tax=Alkalicoccobacillus murimartini TaxID=171685 RepID=A0ABT9YBV5_9BACI|nr:cell wall-active antibiotics response protein LiaF [Alkalicoccobacillus murimartini]MDQ0205326.1 lia operon protein LiaF [Alkalicoccobacillus murimartini]